MTNYAVLRGQQDLQGGETSISMIATGVNRQLDDITRPLLHSSAYTAGATFRNRFHDRQYEIAGQVAASRIGGSPEVLSATQQNAVHYYQQPGDDYELDTTRTSLFGHAEQIKIGKYGGGITRFESGLVRQSAGYVNGLGFSARRHSRLEHVGRAVVPRRQGHLSLGAGERQPLGDVEHVGHAPGERRELQRPHGASEQLGRAPWQHVRQAHRSQLGYDDRRRVILDRCDFKQPGSRTRSQAEPGNALSCRLCLPGRLDFRSKPREARGSRTCVPRQSLGTRKSGSYSSSVT